MVKLPLVSLERVSKSFQGRGRKGFVQAVNDVSLAIERGETMALIGESGSGKSTLGRLVLGLYDPDAGRIVFDGKDLSHLNRREVRSQRKKITVVFQEPFESLDPLMTIGAIVGEPLWIHHRDMDREERRHRVLEVLEMVSLDAGMVSARPASLSGGQQQRVGIARAIVTRPQFIVLDEPTSSLDLSIRAQILNLLKRLQDDLNLAYLFISHDIHTVEHIADRVAVMYSGQILEMGPTTELFMRPRHPYTWALLLATLSADPRERRPLLDIKGEIQPMEGAPSGCIFFERCLFRNDPRCATQQPPLVEVAPNHFAATFYDFEPTPPTIAVSQGSERQ